MNGAESLVRSLLASGVDTCFANPGTSEMHFVAALDKVAGMRCVLGLAETVVTGCADGYGRMAGKPAATLLHCGPGFANGIANVHNARRANTPMVNLIGDHAIYHRPFDSPLTADTAWGAGGVVADALPVPMRDAVAPEVLTHLVQLLRRREPTVMVLSGQALSEAGQQAAHRIALATGVALRASAQVARMPRGRGRVPIDRIPYAIEGALKSLAGHQHVVLVGAKPPTAFFGYPGKPSLMSPPDAQMHVLARPDQDAVAALEWLADALGAPAWAGAPDTGPRPMVQRGAFNPDAFAITLAALLPDNAIVVEDAVTSGRSLFGHTFGAAANDWLQITGGAIGHGFPCATGAAVACPERKTVCLQSDGGGMYALQSLWTQARERLNVVNVVFANRVYKILQGELLAVGAQPGPASNELFDLARPELNWVQLANGMGVEAVRVQTLEGFADAFAAACARPGPFLIEFQI